MTLEIALWFCFGIFIGFISPYVITLGQMMYRCLRFSLRAIKGKPWKRKMKVFYKDFMWAFGKEIDGWEVQ